MHGSYTHLSTAIFVSALLLTVFDLSKGNILEDLQSKA
jgi:hypothetical protein